MPMAATRRRDTGGIEGVRDLAECQRAGTANVLDDKQNIARCPIGFNLDCCDGQGSRPLDLGLLSGAPRALAAARAA